MWCYEWSSSSASSNRRLDTVFAANADCRIGLKVTSLQSCTGEDQIPESLEYSNETSREFDVGIAHDGELPDQVNTDSQAGQ